MSRSYKKFPIIKYGGLGKYGKRQANKKVRNSEIGDFCDYKKLYEQYHIYDVKSNLYKMNKIDGIPKMFHTNNKMSFDEIMDYWRK